MSTTIRGNLGEFIASKKARAGQHSAVPTQFGTVYVPPDGSEFAYLVVKVRLPIAAADCRFGADEQVEVRFLERDVDWRYTPWDGEPHITEGMEKAWKALNKLQQDEEAADAKMQPEVVTYGPHHGFTDSDGVYHPAPGCNVIIKGLTEGDDR